ncbi:DUF1697 domain-containing protein [Sphingomonas sp. So64.6b]|uniref:DUF1697 domain-containing protein n=1 Tax=Sphingomonas sp. So64.6b TaxID=2997354 RepID=UPI00160276E0|nr:DUF1697 domain-containing protein [Sphingomonas sp. So64.6b]QNA83423.1 DUF1697 domain-containing protein [Sphingomonas sp. So64.6b]
MPIKIALFRSMVIGDRRLTREALLRIAEAVGGADARTVIATGNLLFRSHKSVDRLTRELESACAEEYGRATEVIVKTAAQWRTLIAGNPFKAEAEATPSRVIAWAMRDPLPDHGLDQLHRRMQGVERVERSASGDFYCWFGNGEIAGSKLIGGFGLKSLGAVGTNRNWGTVMKIEAAIGQM